jgi:hypothetical protein
MAGLLSFKWVSSTARKKGPVRQQLTEENNMAENESDGDHMVTMITHIPTIGM